MDTVLESAMIDIQIKIAHQIAKLEAEKHDNELWLVGINSDLMQLSKISKIGDK